MSLHDSSNKIGEREVTIRAERLWRTDYDVGLSYFCLLNHHHYTHRQYDRRNSESTSRRDRSTLRDEDVPMLHNPMSVLCEGSNGLDSELRQR
jgi:hypothetical protein